MFDDTPVIFSGEAGFPGVPGTLTVINTLTRTDDIFQND